MAKLSLTDIAAGYLSITVINANNALLEAALENTLSRDGTSPNTMSAALDMNSNLITNLTDGVNAQDASTKAQLDAAVLATAVSLGDLPDVNITTAAKGDLLVYDGSEYIELAVGSDDQVLSASAAAATGLVWNTLAGGGALNNMVEDTTPQLGGNLDLNSKVVNGTGSINITGTIVATSYGAIVEANLVDKSAAETIAGAWALPATASIDSITATDLVSKAQAEAISGEWSVISVARNKTVDYEMVLLDAGQTVRMTGSTAAQTVTIPANASVAFPIGTLIAVTNDSSVAWTLAITTDTLTWGADNTTGSRTLAAGADLVIHKVSTTGWKVNGSALVT